MVAGGAARYRKHMRVAAHARAEARSFVLLCFFVLVPVVVVVVVVGMMRTRQQPKAQVLANLLSEENGILIGSKQAKGKAFFLSPSLDRD